MNAAHEALAYPENFCRICLCIAPKQISLFAEIDGETNLCDILSTLVDSNVTLSHNYPQQICSECHITLCKAFELKQKYVWSEKQLQDALDNLESEDKAANSVLYECNYKDKDFIVPNILESKLECNKEQKTDITHLIKFEAENDRSESCHSDGEYSNDKSQYEHNINLENKDICKSNVPAEVKNEAVSKIVCPKCEIELPSLQSLSIHMKQHIENTSKSKLEKFTFQCSMCMRRFTNKLSLLRHIKKHEETSQVKFLCDTCKREFQHQAHLDNHILKVHTGDKGYNCNFCEKKFRTLKALNVHEDGHKIEKKYQCHMCNKSFIMLSSLNDHIRTHTGEKPHLCFTCGKGFSQKNNLDQHIRRHLGMKPFKCENCDKSFVSKGELVAHNRKHSGAHPFICDDCGSGFTTSSSLLGCPFVVLLQSVFAHFYYIADMENILCCQQELNLRPVGQ
ncbi:unnamed protein product [Leptidea sinapis]|uniref:Protein krueppel n=1 Tax=Leptidea sinapis TaxID=189913 RepID=A0A5E4QHX6_9NEOP|nr:unnamed protein product [Leptidea sinapis]